MVEHCPTTWADKPVQQGYLITVRWSHLSSFINSQFKYVYDTLRDGPLFSWGEGGGWEILKKNCLQGLKKPSKIVCKRDRVNKKMFAENSGKIWKNIS